MQLIGVDASPFSVAIDALHLCHCVHAIIICAFAAVATTLHASLKKHFIKKDSIQSCTMSKRRYNEKVSNTLNDQIKTKQTNYKTTL